MEKPSMDSVPESYFQALAEIAEIINHSTNLRETIAGILDKVDSFMACESGGILLYDERNKELVLQRPSFGEKEADRQPYRLPVSLEQQYERGTAVEVFLSRQPYICNQPTEDKYARKDIIERLGIYNFVTIPLTLKNKVVGVLHAVNKREGDFSPADILFLNTLGTSIAIILEMTRQQNVSKRLINIHNVLTYQVLQGQGLNKIVDTLSEVLQRQVLLEDRFFKTLNFAVPDPSEDSFLMPKLDREAWLKGPARVYYDKMIHDKKPIWLPHLPEVGNLAPRVVAPIVVDKEVLGYLSVGHAQDELEDLELVALEHAATICALEFLKQIIALRAENRVKGDFIRELLTGRLDGKEALNRAAIMGYDLSRAHRVIVIDLGKMTDDEHLRQLYEVVYNYVNAHNPRTMVLMLDGKVVILAPDDISNAKGFISPENLAQGILEHIQGTLELTVFIGLSRSTSQPDQLKRSYQEALLAVRALSETEHKGQILCFEELGIFRLLFQAREKEELLAFAGEMLQPIIEYDKINHTFLLQSLQAYLESNCSVQKTAQKSFLHPNTLLYRLRRIQEISKINLNDPEERLNLQIALRVLHFFKDDEGFSVHSH
ncbi:MAG: helix-turn-helix domain-containing protein [Desulfitobacteriaceae bacterium]